MSDNGTIYLHVFLTLTKGYIGVKSGRLDSIRICLESFTRVLNIFPLYKLPFKIYEQNDFILLFINVLMQRVACCISFKKNRWIVKKTPLTLFFYIKNI
jgi:hypothetical protein